MNISEFIESLQSSQPSTHLSRPLQAMWAEGKGDWDTAHDLVQDDRQGDGAWVHAYLHRKEGDKWNAGYWYRRAGKAFPQCSLEEEWKQIAEDLLEKDEVR